MFAHLFNTKKQQPKKEAVIGDLTPGDISKHIESLEKAQQHQLMKKE